MDLPPLKSTFCPGRHSYGVFGREDLHFRVLAIRINFRSARFFNAGFAPVILARVRNVALFVFGK